jgi:uncharacterized membrane protein
MAALTIGLLVFLGAHSIRIVADDWRSAQIARLGEQRWKSLFSLVSMVGFVLIVWGYGLARAEPGVVWDPPEWMRHITLVLTLPAMILIAAAYVPGNRIKAVLGHPMVAGTKLWAFAHLLSNGRVGDVLLFGAFLVWASVDFAAARQRDRRTDKRYPHGSPAGDVTAVAIGVVVWGLFAFILHRWLTGVDVLPEVSLLGTAAIA